MTVTYARCPESLGQEEEEEEEVKYGAVGQGLPLISGFRFPFSSRPDLGVLIR